jgi:hypothetical protein
MSLFESGNLGAAAGSGQQPSGRGSGTRILHGGAGNYWHAHGSRSILVRQVLSLGDNAGCCRMLRMMSGSAGSLHGAEVGVACVSSTYLTYSV